MKKVINIKFLLLSVCVTVLSSSLYAQQNPLYTQYTYAPAIINPAYAAINDYAEATFIARTQWVGVEGAPTTLSFDFSTPVTERLGAGLTVVYDELGPIKESTLNANVSYKFNVSDNGILSFGLKGGLSFLDSDPLVYSDDNLDPLEDEPISVTAPNLGVGFFYHTDRFFAGISVPSFLETKHLKVDKGVATTASDVMHYYAVSGYVFDLSRELKLKPSMLFEFSNESNSSMDLSLNLFINEEIEFGVSHRRDDFKRGESLSFVVAFNLGQILRIGLGYEYSLNGFRNYNSGTYEALIKTGFRSDYLNSPRFF